MSRSPAAEGQTLWQPIRYKSIVSDQPPLSQSVPTYNPISATATRSTEPSRSHQFAPSQPSEFVSLSPSQGIWQQGVFSAPAPYQPPSSSHLAPSYTSQQQQQHQQQQYQPPQTFSYQPSSHHQPSSHTSTAGAPPPYRPNPSVYYPIRDTRPVHTSTGAIGNSGQMPLPQQHPSSSHPPHSFYHQQPQEYRPIVPNYHAEAASTNAQYEKKRIDVQLALGHLDAVRTQHSTAADLARHAENQVKSNLQAAVSRIHSHCDSIVSEVNQFRHDRISHAEETARRKLTPLEIIEQTIERNIQEIDRIKTTVLDHLEHEPKSRFLHIYRSLMDDVERLLRVEPPSLKACAQTAVSEGLLHLRLVKEQKDVLSAPVDGILESKKDNTIRELIRAYRELEKLFRAVLRNPSQAEEILSQHTPAQFSPSVMPRHSSPSDAPRPTRSLSAPKQRVSYDRSPLRSPLDVLAERRRRGSEEEQHQLQNHRQQRQDDTDEQQEYERHPQQQKPASVTGGVTLRPFEEARPVRRHVSPIASRSGQPGGSRSPTASFGATDSSQVNPPQQHPSHPNPISAPAPPPSQPALAMSRLVSQPGPYAPKTPARTLRTVPDTPAVVPNSAFDMMTSSEWGTGSQMTNNGDISAELAKLNSDLLKKFDELETIIATNMRASQ